MRLSGSSAFAAVLIACRTCGFTDPTGSKTRLSGVPTAVDKLGRTPGASDVSRRSRARNPAPPGKPLVAVTEETSPVNSVARASSAMTIDIHSPTLGAISSCCTRLCDADRVRESAFPNATYTMVMTASSASVPTTSTRNDPSRPRRGCIAQGLPATALSTPVMDARTAGWETTRLLAFGLLALEKLLVIVHTHRRDREIFAKKTLLQTANSPRESTSHAISYSAQRRHTQTLSRYSDQSDQQSLPARESCWASAKAWWSARRPRARC